MMAGLHGPGFPYLQQAPWWLMSPMSPMSTMQERQALYVEFGGFFRGSAVHVKLATPIKPATARSSGHRCYIGRSFP